MLWENLREEEFEAAVKKANGVCVVPVGCVEKHGQHLPLGTDVLHSSQIAALAAEEEYAVVFPSMYFGEKTGAGEFTGTIMFSAELRFKILQETCKEIARNGFKKILLYNGHGGNGSMLGNFSRSVLMEKNDYMVFTANINLATPKKLVNLEYDYLTEEDREILQNFVDENKTYGHGGIVETGWLYHLCPQLVRLDKMGQESGLSTGRFDEFSKRGISTPFGWMANYPNSYTGEPHGMNERIARAMVDYTKDDLKEMIRFLKTETISDEYQREWLSKQ